MEKRCSKCKEKLDTSLFYSNASRKDGVADWCKECAKADQNQRYARDPEGHKARAKTRRTENPERAKAIAKKYEDKYPERRKARWQLWYQGHVAERSESNKQWRLDNAEYDKKRQKEWRAANPEKCRLNNRKAKKKKHATIEGRLHSRMRVYMRILLRKDKGGRSWQAILGYTVKQLKRHLEKQFTEGMSWDAYMRGEIHIDHIVPVSMFTFSSVDDIQFKVCWGLKNLRPMWRLDNIKKSNKLLEPFQQFLL